MKKLAKCQFCVIFNSRRTYMRKIYLLLPLIFSFAILSCPKEPDPPPPPEPQTLDQRLVGGRWYFWNVSNKSQNISQPKTANGYYEFKDEFTFIYSNRYDNLTEYSVYTKDNIIYNKENNQALLKYKFYSQFPYQDISITDDNKAILNSIAANNHIITCTVYLTHLELTDDIDYRWKIIRRFKEDNTPYQ